MIKSKLIIGLFVMSIEFCSFAQQGVVYDTYKYNHSNTNQSPGSIFQKPFQEYNYIKTSRGIEVYATYKYNYDNTNQSVGSIFSKPFPEYYIVNNKIYSTYKYKDGSTNESHGSIFNRPFEEKNINSTASAIKATILQKEEPTKIAPNTKVYQVKTNYSTYSTYKPVTQKYNGPTYDGTTYSDGGSE
jgi:hypothetical protein